MTDELLLLRDQVSGVTIVILQTQCERLCGTCSSSTNKSTDQNPQIADNFNTCFNLPSRSWKIFLENVKDD